MATSRTPLLLTCAIVVGVLLLLKLTQGPPSPRNSSPPTGAPDGATASVQGQGAPDAGSVAEQPGLRDRDPAVGEFVYLFDVSASTHGGSAEDVFQQAVAILVPAYDALRGLDEVMPERHRVGTIGAASLRQHSLCDVYVARPTLFTDGDTLAPRRAMETCERSLRAAPVEQNTDIRGALQYAALSIQGDRPALRGIILVTDLDEDIAAGHTPAVPNLRGVCVATYTLVTDAAARNPALLRERERQWEQSMRGWGARGTRMRSILGFDAEDLKGFFRSCERR
jgi:hypothetical protein